MTSTTPIAKENGTADKKQLPGILKWASAEDGSFKRQVSSFRDWVSSDERATYKPEAGRYHLYVSWACPWAHRTLIVRALKGLESSISVSVVDYLLGPEGWHFSPPEETPGATIDHVNDKKLLSELYFMAEPNYSGRYTVPVLWDKKRGTIVNNESSEIIRMLSSEFNEFASPAGKELDLYPAALKGEIDELNAWVYDTFNNGVYKSGFAITQSAYEAAVVPVFQALDKLETILEKKEFLCGPGTGVFSEADVRCWTTVVRFDPVYHTHFKCNLRTIARDYPSVLRWARRIFQMPGVGETVDMTHIKRHYFMSHVQINTYRVVPINDGPDLSTPVIKEGTVGAGPSK